MLNAQGRPRYWLGAYDAWHLLLPAALIAVLAVLALAPRPATPQRIVAAPPPPLTPSAITNLAAGTTLRARAFGAIQGTAHPQARIFLFLRQIPHPERVLAETRSATNGVFQFTLAGFPPGDYGFRVEAVAADGRRAASPEIPVRLTAEPAPAPAPRKAAPPAAGRKPAATKPPARKPEPARKPPARD